MFCYCPFVHILKCSDIFSINLSADFSSISSVGDMMVEVVLWHLAIPLSHVQPFPHPSFLTLVLEASILASSGDWMVSFSVSQVVDGCQRIRVLSVCLSADSVLNVMEIVLFMLNINIFFSTMHHYMEWYSWMKIILCCRSNFPFFIICILIENFSILSISDGTSFSVNEEGNIIKHTEIHVFGVFWY